MCERACVCVLADPVVSLQRSGQAKFVHMICVLLYLSGWLIGRHFFRVDSFCESSATMDMHMQGFHSDAIV